LSLDSVHKLRICWNVVTFLSSFLSSFLIQESKSKQYEDDKRSEIPPGSLNNTEEIQYFLRNPYNFSMSFNTDGANPFGSSKASIWPLCVSYNEIPILKKSSFLALHSLYFGITKPKMETFLKPFVEETKKLYNEEISFTFNRKTVVSKILFPLCVAVTPCRCCLCCCHQWKGENGYWYCYHPGVRLDGPGNVRVYPIETPRPTVHRTHEECLRNLKILMETVASHVKGIKGPSIKPLFDPKI